MTVIESLETRITVVFIAQLVTLLLLTLHLCAVQKERRKRG